MLPIRAQDGSGKFANVIEVSALAQPTFVCSHGLGSNRVANGAIWTNDDRRRPRLAGGLHPTIGPAVAANEMDGTSAKNVRKNCRLRRLTDQMMRQLLGPLLTCWTLTRPLQGQQRLDNACPPDRTDIGNPVSG